MTRRKHLTTTNTGDKNYITQDSEGAFTVMHRRKGHAGGFRPARKPDPRPVEQPKIRTQILDAYRRGEIGYE